MFQKDGEAYAGRESNEEVDIFIKGDSNCFFVQVTDAPRWNVGRDLFGGLLVA